MNVIIDNCVESFWLRKEILVNFAKMQDFVQPLIKPDEELTIDYGVGYFGRNQKSVRRARQESKGRSGRGSGARGRT